MTKSNKTNPKPPTRRTRKTYDDPFKRDAVKLLAQPGYTLAKAAAALGVSQASLSSWKKTLLPRESADLTAEVTKLHRRVRELEMERDILKNLPGERRPTSRRRASEIRLHPRAA